MGIEPQTSTQMAHHANHGSPCAKQTHPTTSSWIYTLLRTWEKKTLHLWSFWGGFRNFGEAQCIKKGCQSENVLSIKAGTTVDLHVGAGSEVFVALRESQVGGQDAKLGAECCPYITFTLLALK
jgi:hypothetical protein